MSPRFVLVLALLSPVFSGSSAIAQKMTTPTRERLSINANWCFHQGDPQGATPILYDYWPEETEGQDGKAADAQPEAASKLKASSTPILKPWILPTANRFIKAPSKRYVRPDVQPEQRIEFVQNSFNDSSWRQVDLPHDWAIAGPFNASWKGVGGGMGRLPSPGIGWYRKKLNIPASDKGRSLFLDVDGAMSYAMVWLNGQLVGGWPYGYNSWRVDLTPYIVAGGENVLAIRLDNPPDSSRWYPGGGIYRNVWLVKTQPVHVAQWGTSVTTPEVAPQSAKINLEVTINNDSTEPKEISVATEIYRLDEAGRRVGRSVARMAPTVARIVAGESTKIESSVQLANPHLWGPPPQQRPNRYVAVTTLSKAGQIVDSYETPFGIRSIRFVPDSDIQVNGQPIKIQGVNQHHDLGALGAAFNLRAAERQLQMLREMGCNAIRMSHNPPSPELLELTDRMGFLVVDEIFDIWERKKTPFGSHLVFPEWHEPDLRAMIRRDRNHPSVFLWSVGNEVGEQYTGPEGAKVGRQLTEIAHDEDPTRLTTTAMNFAKPDMPLPATVDVIGLNYQGEGIRDAPAYAGMNGIRTSPLYPGFREKFPDKVILSTESAAALSTRGEYLFPVFDGVSSPVKDGQGGDPQNHYVSSYELYTADFGSSADKVFASQDKYPYVAGEFVWSGWDYLGEPTPYYTSRSSYFGIIDLAGFKKDRFYLYQSRWRPDLPMAHILPHWNWPERGGQVTPVHVFTSGDEAELFLNGQSLGRKKKASFEYRLRWDDVVYQPGELKVVAYKNGKLWAIESVKTTKAPAKLVMTPDRKQIAADGLDLSFVTVRVTDKNGATAPRAKHSLRFSIEGPGEIVATDNGDPTDLTPFPSHERKAFNGLCLVIVRAKAGQSGKITLRAESDALQNATQLLTAVAKTTD